MNIDASSVTTTTTTSNQTITNQNNHPNTTSTATNPSLMKPIVSASAAIAPLPHPIGATSAVAAATNIPSTNGKHPGKKSTKGGKKTKKKDVSDAPVFLKSTYSFLFSSCIVFYLIKCNFYPYLHTYTFIFVLFLIRIDVQIFLQTNHSKL